MSTFSSAPKSPGVDRSSIVAFGWGLAEALIFFIVPDVFLTRLALRDLRKALLGCLWATAGALIGGVILWEAASHGQAPRILHLFKWLPGIGNNLIAVTGQETERIGAAAMFWGAVLGRPYKLYAVHAGAQDVALASFIWMSVAARALRFAVTSGLAWLVGKALAAKPDPVRMRLHLLFWVAFYALYFVAMRW